MSVQVFGKVHSCQSILCRSAAIASNSLTSPPDLETKKEVELEKHTTMVQAPVQS
jgi:hypothetical protein